MSLSFSRIEQIYLMSLGLTEREVDKQQVEMVKRFTRQEAEVDVMLSGS